MTTPMPVNRALGATALALLVPVALAAFRSDPPPPTAHVVFHPPPVAFHPPPSVKRDDLNRLLDDAARRAHRDTISCLLGCDPPDKTRRDDGQHTKGDIVFGMSKIKGRVAACYDRFGMPGLANVSVTISARGEVTDASVSGSFAGTPTGACVEAAVRTASFPPAKVGEMINYPFMLR
jgi:hypothetical protein